jgi:hypothetical protein
MVWTSQIITDSLRRVTTQEDRSGVSNLTGDQFVILSHDLDVLGREFIYECPRLVETFNDNYRAVVS